MPLTLYVDGSRWREHLRAAASAAPGLIPVAKGNGYGFTVGRLARRAQWLGCDMIAVGTYREVPEVASRFAGSILVLEPWRPFLSDVGYSERLVHTVGRLDDLASLVARDDSPRVVLEALTSMRRHGFSPTDLATASRARGVRIQGCALHLPLTGRHVGEVERWMARMPTSHWFVSHLRPGELDDLARRHPGVTIRPRVGTGLWLGDRAALSARATVHDTHPVDRGDRVGYRQRRIGRAGTLLVVAGGTAHGIGLEAPAAAASARQRAVSMARGGLEATGRALSPFLVSGRQRWFVEPPHMQVSMIFVPAGVSCPAIGDEVDVQVRFTTTHFDQVLTS